MKTDILPGPWMTYVNVHEPENGWQRVSFGGMDYSPNNAPKQYWIDKEIVGLKLIFRSGMPLFTICCCLVNVGFFFIFVSE